MRSGCEEQFSANPVDDSLDSAAFSEVGENKGMFPTRPSRVAIHYGKVGSDVWGEVNLVNHQEPRSHYARTTFSRYLIALGHIDYIYRSVNQFGTEGSCKIVAAALYDQNIEVVETSGQQAYGFKIDRGILADSGMWTSAGFDAYDPIGIEYSASREELRIFASVYIVSDNCDLIWTMHPATQPFNERCLARPDGTSDPDFQWLWNHDLNNRPSKRAWRIPAISKAGAKLDRSSIPSLTTSRASEAIRGAIFRIMS